MTIRIWIFRYPLLLKAVMKSRGIKRLSLGGFGEIRSMLRDRLCLWDTRAILKCIILRGKMKKLHLSNRGTECPSKCLDFNLEAETQIANLLQSMKKDLNFHLSKVNLRFVSSIYEILI
jgi:hypothetical protein